MHNNDWKTAEKMVATRSGLQAKYLSKSIREKAHLREEWNRQIFRDVRASSREIP